MALDPTGRIFVTHTTGDDRTLVEPLVARLEALGVRCWVDSERLRDGDRLDDILAALRGCRGQVALLTPAALGSKWVAKELAEGLARAAAGDGFRVVPLRRGVTQAAVEGRFPALKDLVSVDLERFPGWGIERLLFALGELPSPGPPPRVAPAPDEHELVLCVERPRLSEETDAAGVRRMQLDAELRLLVRHGPAAPARLSARGSGFRSPLGRLEADDLRWYVEDYWLWPAEEFVERARRIEAALDGWGVRLWEAVAAAVPDGAALLRDWLRESADSRRLLTVRVAAPAERPAGMEATPDEVAAARGAAALLALPWELLHDGTELLAGRTPPVAVRRQVTFAARDGSEPVRAPDVALEGPIRVLLVVARPEKAGLIDPRASADALLDALEPLGAAVHARVLRPPTLAALAAELKAAEGRGAPYHVLHFDGHGVYDPQEGLGMLCFEHRDPTKRAAGEPELIAGPDLREALGELRLPLVVLDACQTAKTGEEDEPTAAVATALLQAGARSAVAMRHSVLVETARRFTAAFYAALCAGQTVGAAVTAGRAALLADPRRDGGGDGARPFELRDWFVPELLALGDDPALIPGGAAVAADPTARAARERALASVPPEPEHRFFGRVPERLAIERAFEDRRVVMLDGIGGQGKTALAADVARWLYRTNRFPGGVAFVSVEDAGDLPVVLDRVGKAIWGAGFTVAGAAERLRQGQGAADGAPAGGAEAASLSQADVAAARKYIRQHFEKQATLLVLDNLETQLPPPEDAPAAAQSQVEPERLKALLDLVVELARAGDSRALVTTREAVPKDPRFREGKTTKVLELRGLAERDAVALVGHVCRLAGVDVETGDEGAAALRGLVQAVGCHPRSLVLLPGQLEGRPLRAVTQDLHRLFREMEERNPGDRENSLYASLKLSLDRLPGRFRETARWLGLFRVGVHE